MPLRSLRARILAISSALVVGLSAATLLYVGTLASRAVGDRIAADLRRSRDLVAAAEAERYRDLALVAQLVASFPELRALLATDTATIRDFLGEYRQRQGRSELLVALDPLGRVLARTDTFAPLAIPGVEQTWLQPARDGRDARGVLEIEGHAYHASAAPAEAGGTIFGVVLAAAPIDDEWARALRNASGDEIVALTPRGVAGSTLPQDRLPWRSMNELGNVTEDMSEAVTVGGERFTVIAAPAEEGVPLRILALQSRDLALAPYRRIQVGLIVLGLVAATLGIGGSALLARSMTAPISALVAATRQVAAGNFDVRLPAARTDEIGQLAAAFNQMTEGLRQHADMQKFVSQSTVHMIEQAHAVQAGDRRTITVLFADIRGFTAYAEQHRPEEAVTVLNRYLRLEADLVKKFGGDVDKFMGDAVFAVFGGADMALDAIRCAVEIHHAVARENAADPAAPALAVGVGIATGDVIVGSIGSEDRLDYTVVGTAVNLGARLCANADAREILMSEETFARVRGLVAADPLPPLTVKGLREPVRVYRMAVSAA